MSGLHYLPLTEKERRAMLEFIGAASVDDLFRDIPDEVCFKGDMRLPPPLSEFEALAHLGTLAALLQAAWQVRRERFPHRVEFVYPRLTLPVRSTGVGCALNCAHCGGHYLKGMVSLEKALRQKKGLVKSYLISGACDSRGRVPHMERWEEILELSRRGPLNVHPGLVSETEAAALGRAARVVSFDFTADAETIEQIYGLPVAPAAFLESYRLLRGHCRVVPHICIGLLRGRISGEYKALDALKQEGAEAISFIVFRPTPGTRLELCSPPPVEEAAGLLAAARIMFPDTPLYLGCLRPGGRYREALDSLALKAGVNKIVQPAPAARRLAARLEMEITRGEECCAL